MKSSLSSCVTAPARTLRASHSRGVVACMSLHLRFNCSSSLGPGMADPASHLPCSLVNAMTQRPAGASWLRGLKRPVSTDPRPQAAPRLD
jgi:hypothetical protein